MSHRNDSYPLLFLGTWRSPWMHRRIHVGVWRSLRHLVDDWLLELVADPRRRRGALFRTLLAHLTPVLCISSCIPRGTHNRENGFVVVA